MIVPRHDRARPNHRPPVLFRWPALLFVVLLASGRSLLADEVNWRSDYAAALKEAAEKGRPLFVNVGTEACYWCKQLEARTLNQDEIVKLLNERCVPIKIDGNRNAYIVQALRVQSYPTLVFAGPDGSILGYREGFLEPAPFKEQLIRALTAVAVPDWMQRDFDAACKAVAASDYPRAMSLLRTVVEDGKSRPLQVRARRILDDLEKQASEQATRARELADKGKTAEAIATINELNKVYPGTLAAREGKQLLLKLTSKSGESEERSRQARELLDQAREDYRNRQYLSCRDRCERLKSRFAEFPESTTAERMATEIKSNPEWTRQASEEMGERLCVLYLALADAWLKKGQPQQASFYLERVMKMFPGTPHAEIAQGKLTRLRGSPPGDLKK